MSASSTVYSYDVDKILLTLTKNNATFTVSGFAPDSKVTIEKDEDNWAFKSSCDGSIHVRSKLHPLVYTVTIKLLWNSPSNEILNTWTNLDISSNDGLFDISIAEEGNKKTFTGKNAFVTKIPSVNIDKEAAEIEWAIKVPYADFTIK
jgi:hypothetical protein